MTDFAQERHQAENRLAELRRQAGQHRLDGKAFDHAPIVEAEHELEDVTGAEAAQVQRAREAESVRLAALHRTLSLEFTEKEAERLRLVGRAEKAASHLVEALSGVLAVAAEQRGVFRRMNRPGSQGVSELELTQRLGNRLAARLNVLPGNTQRFGHVNWHSSWLKPDDSWVDSERRATSEFFEKLNKEI